MVVTFPVLLLSVNIQRTDRNFCFWPRQSDRDRNPPWPEEVKIHTRQWASHNKTLWFLRHKRLPRDNFQARAHGGECKKNPEESPSWGEGTETSGRNKCSGWSTEEAKARQETLEPAEDPPQALAEA